MTDQSLYVPPALGESLSSLPAGSPVADTDVFYSVQGVLGSLASVKQTASTLKAYMGGTSIGGAIGGGTAGSVLFVGSGSVIAQDNANFFWDDTNFNLEIAGSGTGQGIVQIAGHNALYRVSNALGDNWFEGGAGNLTVTGQSNFGTGENALSSVTTGFFNVAIGDASLQHLTTGSGNTALGHRALQTLAAGANNFAMGVNALQNLNDPGAENNVAIGGFSSASMTTGSSNLAIGNNALFSETTGTSIIGIGADCAHNGSGNSGCMFIGTNSGFNNSSSFGAINIGQSSGHEATGSFATIYIGTQSGYSLVSGAYNTFVGYASGEFITGGRNNTILGTWNGPSASVNGIVVLSDGGEGSGNLLLDWKYLTSQVWSIKFNTSPTGLQIYNTWDGAVPTVNYERSCLDWNLTSNVFRIASQAGGTGTVRLIAIDGFQKAGAPAAGDLPSTTWTVINDTSGGQTWLVYNNAGTIRKVQLV